MSLPVRVPVDIGREEAAQAAREELTRPVYQADEDPWVVRAARWLLEQINVLLDRVAAESPGGYLGLFVVLVALVALAVVIRARTGSGARHARRSPTIEATSLTAAEHRAAAVRAAQTGRWAEAIRERIRALAGEVTEQGLVAERPGRTADELAAEVGAALPELAGELRAATEVFDAVWYGEQPADLAAYQLVAEVEDHIRRDARSVRPSRTAPRVTVPQ
jgi:hypothetical protein